MNPSAPENFLLLARRVPKELAPSHLNLSLTHADVTRKFGYEGKIDFSFHGKNALEGTYHVLYFRDLLLNEAE